MQMLYHVVDIFLCCCKAWTLNLLLVPSNIRFREGLQERTLTAEGSPRVRIRIVQEYAHQIGTKTGAYGMLLPTEHIVGTSNRPNAPK